MKRLLVMVGYSTAVAAYLALGWIAGLIVLVAALASTVQLFRRTAAEYAPTCRCPHGHRVPTYGRVRCTVCGWVSEGSIWRCPHCNAVFGHTSCPDCGLSVHNPSL